MERRSGGARQRIWTLLREAVAPLTDDALAAGADCKPTSARVYLNGLAKHGLVERAETGWRLISDTGPTCPAYNNETGELRDWNVDKPMSRHELEHAWKTSGLSIRQFCIALGLNAHHITKLRHMMSGQRPVTSAVEAAVKAWRGLARGTT